MLSRDIIDVDGVRVSGLNDGGQKAPRSAETCRLTADTNGDKGDTDALRIPGSCHGWYFDILLFLSCFIKVPPPAPLPILASTITVIQVHGIPVCSLEQFFFVDGPISCCLFRCRAQAGLQPSPTTYRCVPAWNIYRVELEIVASFFMRLPRTLPPPTHAKAQNKIKGSAEYKLTAEPALNVYSITTWMERFEAHREQSRNTWYVKIPIFCLPWFA